LIDDDSITVVDIRWGNKELSDTKVNTKTIHRSHRIEDPRSHIHIGF
jgi:hypothetical protein